MVSSLTYVGYYIIKTRYVINKCKLIIKKTEGLIPTGNVSNEYRVLGENSTYTLQLRYLKYSSTSLKTVSDMA